MTVYLVCRVYGTWDFKSFHLWSMETGARTNIVKMIDVTKTHCTISAVAFSHRYRVSDPFDLIIPLLTFCLCCSNLALPSHYVLVQVHLPQ